MIDEESDFSLSLSLLRRFVSPPFLFFGAALSPALEYQDELVGENADPILLRAAMGALRMIRVAAGAIAIALPLGLLLAYLSSESWWSVSASLTRHRKIFKALSSAARIVATFFRSVHELLWAILFLASLGLTELTGTIAISIPFAGTFAKVFGEMFDEQDRSTADYLDNVGSPMLSTFIGGILPRAFPDLLSYTFYRFECALRSSAVIGFFGIESLGLYIRQSTENLYFNETWTYLYALLALLILFEFWNIKIRERVVAIKK